MNEQQQREADLRDFNRYWWREDDEKYNSADQESHRTTWLAALALARAAQQQQQWIACSERLPDVDGLKRWLVFNGSVQPTAHFYLGPKACWVSYPYKELEGVTYWMPLPAPPAASEGKV